LGAEVPLPARRQAGMATDARIDTTIERKGLA
jgi:hypothetical protein